MDFQKVVENLDANHKYFYCAFATNVVGTSYGSVESFKTLNIQSGPDWIDARPGADPNWWTSEWFGSFYAPDNRGWIMHQELGWVFAYGQPDRAVWLWHAGLGLGVDPSRGVPISLRQSVRRMDVLLWQCTQPASTIRLSCQPLADHCQVGEIF